MGYRARLGKIAKTERLKYKGKSLDEVDALFGGEDDWDKNPYRPAEHTSLYELGKYVEYSGTMKEFMEEFYDFSCYDEYESEFWIISKEGLAEIIDDYRKIVRSNYVEVQTNVYKLESFLKSREREWSKMWGMTPYYLDRPPEKCDGFLVSSWQYEYAIFNLVHIYRTFDWDNDYLIYSAW